MHKTKKELYGLISDLKTKKEFEKEIKQRFLAHDGLFNEDALALFLVDELGRNTQTITPLSQMEANKEYVVAGMVTAISEVKVFRRKDGTAGKVLNLEMSDASGMCRLVLWNDEIDLVKNKEIQSGTKVRIINGYTKQGYSGVELHLGKWGLLELEPSESCGNGNIPQQITNMITGVLVKKEPTRAFFKENGEFGFVTTITLKEQEKETQVTLWDTSVKEIQRYTIGERLTLKNVTIKRNNGKTELHLNGNGTFHKHR